MRLGLKLRPEPRFERSYRRNVGNVYHYALGVLSDPEDAEEVTHTAFLNAQRECSRVGAAVPDLDSLLAIAHEVCRIRGGHGRLTDADLADDQEPADPCDAAQRAVSRRADGQLPRREGRALRRHLEACNDCHAFAELQTAQKDAVAALATVPLPASLGPARVRLGIAARVGALAATAALVLALAASGGIPNPANFLAKERGPEAEAGITDRQPPERKFPRPAASPR